jgi:hypothetical protein
MREAGHIGILLGVAMNDQLNDQREDVLERLTQQLDLARRLRESAKADPELEAGRQRLRAWQAVRLARTHADLLASPSMGPAAAFFLSDLYGSKDLTQLDADVRRVVPTMKRLLPAASLETVADAIELEALSEHLDLAMVAALGPRLTALDAAAYSRAYRKIDHRADRERQIDLIADVGRSLDRLVHQPLIGTALSMMRRPARFAGLSELHDFLQRGYDAFRTMSDAGEFLSLIVSRERNLLEALFAGDDSLPG